MLRRFQLISKCTAQAAPCFELASWLTFSFLLFPCLGWLGQLDQKVWNNCRWKKEEDMVLKVAPSLPPSTERRAAAAAEAVVRPVPAEG